nr:hypothetical protein [uncultured Cohaesibacter sp.]
MRNERPFRQEARKREIVICKSVPDGLDRWRNCPDAKFKRQAGSILLFSYVQSGLGNRETVGLAFPSSGECGRFIDTLAMMSIEGRVMQ